MMLIKEKIMITPLSLEQTLHIYLPNGYESSNQRYPVMYMYDGHNLFEDDEATYGKSWGLKDYLDYMDEEIIIVGIECNHEGMKRIEEYCPYTFKNSFLGYIRGQGKIFMDWVVDELKPYIDENLRTLKDREHTAIGGSSMGGLMSIYSLSMYNETFSKAACLSSFLGDIIKELLVDIDHQLDHDSKFYISWGSEEFKNKPRLVNGCSHHLNVINTLLKNNAQVYINFIKDGTHSESSWEKEVPTFIDYLFHQ